MKLAKTIAIGAAVIGLAAGSALVSERSYAVNEIYGIDEDRDGVIDGYLLLEESDTLA
jgi:uncharacterized BrkB/YihY/UPF0761 family membrane protein